MLIAARESMAIRPLFMDQAPGGMSDDDFKTYQRMARRSVEQAEQRLLKKTMAKVKRARERWYKTEKSSVRSEVESAINSQRAYRLIEMLANKFVYTDRVPRSVSVHVDGIMEALVKIYDAHHVAEELTGE